MPSQVGVIERILRHCGLWEGALRTLACARAPPHGSPRDPNEPRDLELVPDPEFREAEFRETLAEASRELQLALDERVPLARAKSAPFFPPEIPDSLAVRADGPA